MFYPLCPNVGLYPCEICLCPETWANHFTSLNLSILRGYWEKGIFPASLVGCLEHQWWKRTCSAKPRASQCQWLWLIVASRGCDLEQPILMGENAELGALSSSAPSHLLTLTKSPLCLSITPLSQEIRALTPPAWFLLLWNKGKQD